MTIDITQCSTRLGMEIANRELNKVRRDELKMKLLQYCTVDDKMKVAVVDHERFAETRRLIDSMSARIELVSDQLDLAEQILTKYGFSGDQEIKDRINNINAQLYDHGARYMDSEVPEDLVAWSAHKHFRPLIEALIVQKNELEAILIELRTTCKDVV